MPQSHQRGIGLQPLMVATLPPLASDPFDRILIAQAMSEPLHLVTTDAKLKPYSELVVLV
jgi:PIN domain nuclease of toxin-antitoxin system